jgi:hypothetical protein
VQSPPFHGQIGIEVLMGCLNALVTEPHGDHGQVHAGLEEMDCCGVAPILSSE